MHLRIPFVFSSIFLAAFTSPVFAAPAPGPAAAALEKRDISQTLFDDFVRYTRWAQTARPDSCPRPLGNTLVSQIENRATDTQGIIARDDTRKEIVVAFRGSEHPLDFVIDLIILLVPFRPNSVPSSFTQTAQRTSVHAGFLTAFNTVASTIVSTVRDQLNSHPGYSVVTSGHSLGGALASLAGVTLKANFPSTPLRVYTFGQPRTGDRAFADLVENVVGAGNVFRSVHTTDLISHLPPQEFGYRHHGTEYWNFRDPASAANVRRCTGQEDASCSEGNPGSILDSVPAHLTYYGQTLGQDNPSLCQ